MKRGTGIYRLWALLLLGGCQPSVDELVPLPDLNTDGLLSVVVTQLETARESVIRDPTSAAKNGNFALALHAYDHSESAFVLYERARQLAPRDPQWPYYQSAVLQRLGDLEGSLRALDDALQLRTKHIDVMAKRGEALFLLARFDEAEDQLKKVLDINPDYPLANYYMAKIHVERQEWAPAAKTLEDLLQRGLDVREVHQNLGTVYRVLGRAEEANRHLNLAMREDGLVIKSFDPINMVVAKLNQGDQPHLLAARAYYYRGNLEAAKKELMVALEKNPDSIAGHSHLLRVYAEESEMIGARRHFDKVMELEPTNAIAYASWGLALANNGRYDESAVAYRKAVELVPSDLQLRVALAGVLARGGLHEEALRQIQDVIASDPDNVNANVLRGNALLVLGRDEEALKVLEALPIPDKDIRGALILRSISQAQLKLGQTDAALRTLRQAAAIAQEIENMPLVESIELELDKYHDATIAD